MNSKPHRDEWLPSEPLEDDIRRRAYDLWLSDGQVHGRDLEHWFTARQLLLHQAKEHYENGVTPFVPSPLNHATLRRQRLRLRGDQRARIAAGGNRQRLRAHHQPRAERPTPASG